MSSVLMGNRKGKEQMQRGAGHVKMAVETGMMRLALRNARNCKVLKEAKRFSHRDPCRSKALWDFRLLAFRTVRQQVFVVLSNLVCCCGYHRKLIQFLKVNLYFFSKRTN